MCWLIFGQVGAAMPMENPNVVASFNKFKEKNFTVLAFL
jgi:hypothetical protein